MTFSPTITAQIVQIQRKLRERTIGSPQPTHNVDNPVWNDPPKKESPTHAGTQEARPPRPHLD